jgi:hypothetical protein
VKQTPLGPGEKSRERGSTFANPRTELRRENSVTGKTTARRRRPISPASKAQREKIALNPFCVNCGREQSEWLAVDPGHLCPRGLGGCDDPDCVVGLCRTFAGEGCHRDVDDGKVDLLPKLEPRYRTELAHCIMHLGLEGARKRLAPSLYRRESP